MGRTMEWEGNPQREHGHAQISTELLVALCRTRMPDAARRLFMAIVTATYAYRRDTVALTLAEVQLLTGLSSGPVTSARAELMKRGMVSCQPPTTGRGEWTYRLNKRYTTWRPATDVPAQARGVIHRHPVGGAAEARVHEPQARGHELRSSSSRATSSRTRASIDENPRPDAGNPAPKKEEGVRTEEGQALRAHVSAPTRGLRRQSLTSSTSAGADPEIEHELDRLLRACGPSTDAGTRQLFASAVRRGAMASDFADARAALGAVPGIGNRAGYAFTVIAERVEARRAERRTTTAGGDLDRHGDAITTTSLEG